MKANKILIWGGLLTIMHYVDFLLFDRGFPFALLAAAAAGAVCGIECGAKKFGGTAANALLALALYVLLIFLTGKLNIYEQIMFPHGMTEDNYMSASNQGAAGLLIMLILAVNAVSVFFGAVVSYIARNSDTKEDQR